MKCFDVSMQRSSTSTPPPTCLLLRLCHRLSMNNNPQELSNLFLDLVMLGKFYWLKLIFTLPSRSQRINALIVKTGNKWLFQKSKKDNVAHFHFSNFTIEHETLLSSLLIARCWLGEAWKIYLLKLSVFLHYSTWLMAFREHKWTQHTVSPQKKS